MKTFAKIICTILTFLLFFNTTTYATELENASTHKEINVPIKYICESLGGVVSWNAKNKVALIQYNKKELQLKMGSNVIISNGKTKTLKSKVSTVNGRTILPISVLNQELGLKLTNDDCLKIIGVKFIALLKSGKADECSGLLSKIFSKYLSTKYINMIANSISKVQFDDKELTLTKNTVHQNLSIPFVVGQVNYNYILRFDYTGKIDELSVTAEQKPMEYSIPSYNGTYDFTQEEVTFGDGTWKLPATLTVPKGKGPFPVVILVHGSGPQDRDQTVGALKPFRDLAIGLSGENIAVLRYEKRSIVHSTKMSLIGNITMNEETEQDVFEAAEYLKNDSRIDASNIIVLGHSLGGYALPKILQADKADTFKAGIIMSGFTRPIYELIPEQLEDLMTKGMASKEQLEYIKGQVELLKDPSFNATNPPESYTLGNAYYYNYMKLYDVLSEAKALNKPMFVIQGERDYQVSPKIDFEGWKKAFTGKQEVDFKLYPKLNHMYMEGEGDSTPEEYNVSSNIPQYVIDDIASFVNKISLK